MAKLKRMDQIKIIITTYLETGSIKATHRRLKISKNTVRNYIRKAEAKWKDLKTVAQLSDEELSKVFYRELSEARTLRERDFDERLDGWIKELSKPGVTRYLLWEEYKQYNPDGYQYSQFCSRFRTGIKRKDLTIALNHPPGEVMQLDFCGKTMSWVDSETGEVHKK